VRRCPASSLCMLSITARVLRRGLRVFRRVLANAARPALGLGEKSEIPALAQSPGGITESQRTRVPQGVEHAHPAADSRTRWALQARWSASSRAALQARPWCHRSPTPMPGLVEGLSAHLSAVVHAHQGRSIAAYLVAKIFLGDGISRTGSARDRLAVQDRKALSNSRMQRSRSKRVWLEISIENPSSEFGMIPPNSPVPQCNKCVRKKRRPKALLELLLFLLTLEVCCMPSEIVVTSVPAEAQPRTAAGCSTCARRPAM